MYAGVISWNGRKEPSEPSEWERLLFRQQCGLSPIIRSLVLAASSFLFVSLSTCWADENVKRIGLPEAELLQLDKPPVQPQLVEVNSFIQAERARAFFNVDGSGLAAAVLDGGLRLTHQDFDGEGRIPAHVNFSGDDNCDPSRVTDNPVQGHGTHVAGIIAAHKLHTGIAPGANLVPLKVKGYQAAAAKDDIEQILVKALQWVITNHKKFKITVINISAGNPMTYVNDGGFNGDKIRGHVKALRNLRIPVTSSAGNAYKVYERQGMCFPGIFRETVSVGAVYDADIGSVKYPVLGMALARSTGPGRITPFSQRLHENVGELCRTDIFAPGATTTSTGVRSDHGESLQTGTSQAAPVTAGVILLMQEYYLRKSGKYPLADHGDLPSVDDLEQWLREGGVEIQDGDDEDDNVPHTNLKYWRLDAYGALDRIDAEFQLRQLKNDGQIR